MTDFLLEIFFSDPAAEELIQARLYLTASTGSVTADGRVEAYFATAADRDAAAALFANAKATDRPRLDWLQLYQQSLQPLLVGRSFVIAPEESLFPRDPNRHRLLIPQEQAFGTGGHESTALCIELLEEIDLRDRCGLDIGTGSGILALAMLRLGARKVVAFDNDVDVYAALRQNAIRNKLVISAFIGTLDALRGGKFDVITMNILPEFIVPLLPRVRRHLNGVLIVSGILRQRRDDVARHIRVVKERTKGEWWAAILSE